MFIECCRQYILYCYQCSLLSTRGIIIHRQSSQETKQNIRSWFDPSFIIYLINEKKTCFIMKKRKKTRISRIRFCDKLDAIPNFAFLSLPLHNGVFINNIYTTKLSPYHYPKYDDSYGKKTFLSIDSFYNFDPILTQTQFYVLYLSYIFCLPHKTALLDKRLASLAVSPYKEKCGAAWQRLIQYDVDSKTVCILIGAMTQ